MSANRLSVRLIGALPATEDLDRLLDVTHTRASRRGTVVSRRVNWIAEEDVWSLDLIARDQWSDGLPEESALSNATATIQRMTPGLLALEHAVVRTELYISTIREEDSGGFLLSSELIHAAATANLTLVVSVLVLLSEEFDEDEISFYGTRTSGEDVDPSE